MKHASSDTRTDTATYIFSLVDLRSSPQNVEQRAARITIDDRMAARNEMRKENKK